jgi:hypothetical protein
MRSTSDEVSRLKRQKHLEKMQKRVLACRTGQDVFHYGPRVDRCRLKPTEACERILYYIIVFLVLLYYSHYCITHIIALLTFLYYSHY